MTCKYFRLRRSSRSHSSRSQGSNREQLEILTPKQMLQRLSVALAQVNAGNTSESLINEIRQIIYSLY